jgi:GTP-binding protein
VVEFDDYSRLIFADIPGVIKGASHGKGLGFEFLRHIERTNLLLFILDITSKTIEHDYIALMHELTTYSATFSKYPRIIAINKIDLTEGALRKPIFGEVTFPISALKGTGIKPLLEKIQSMLTNTGGTNGKQKRTT